MNTSKPKSRFDEVALRHCDAYANILQEAVGGAFRVDAIYKIANPTNFKTTLDSKIGAAKNSSPPSIPVDEQYRLSQLSKRIVSPPAGLPGGEAQFLEVGFFATRNGTTGDPVKVATDLYTKVVGNSASGGFELGNFLTAYNRPPNRILKTTQTSKTPGVAKTPGSPSSPGANPNSREKTGTNALGQQIVAGHKEILNTLDKSAPTVQTR